MDVTVERYMRRKIVTNSASPQLVTIFLRI